MVFIEPGLAEQIGTAGIDKLVAGINHVINPDYQFQEAMKVQLATNPKLAQELSDLETSAPGTLKSLGFGSLTKVLTSIPESAAGQVAREAKPEIVAGQKAQIQAKSAEAQFQGKSFADALASIKGDDPASVQLRHELINRVVTGSISPEEDVALKKAQAEEQRSRADILKAQEPGVIAKAQIENLQYKRVIDNYPKIAAMNPVQIIRDLANGKDPGDLIGFLGQGPAAQEALTHARIIYEAQEARDQRLLMWAQIHAQKDPMHAANIQAARQLLLQTKTGTIAAWYTAITEPEKIDELKAKQEKGATLTPDEKDILAVDVAQKKQQQQIDEKQAAGENMALFRAVNDIRSSIAKGDNPGVIGAGVDALNNVFQSQGKNITAVYGVQPNIGESKPGTRFFGLRDNPTALYFVGPDGTRIKEEDVFRKPVDISQTPGNAPKAAKLDSASARTLAVIQSKTGQEKANTIAWIQKNQPGIYARIKDLIK